MAVTTTRYLNAIYITALLTSNTQTTSIQICLKSNVLTSIRYNVNTYFKFVTNFRPSLEEASKSLLAINALQCYYSSV
jgi:hypothetical protein